MVEGHFQPCFLEEIDWSVNRRCSSVKYVDVSINNTHLLFVNQREYCHCVRRVNALGKVELRSHIRRLSAECPSIRSSRIRVRSVLSELNRFALLAPVLAVNFGAAVRFSQYLSY